MKFSISGICEQFGRSCVGTRVTDTNGVLGLLPIAVEATEKEEARLASAARRTRLGWFAAAAVIALLTLAIPVAEYGFGITNIWGAPDVIVVLCLAVLVAMWGRRRTTKGVPGQYFVFLPEEANAMVIAGQGKREGREAGDFFHREYRGKVSSFMRRRYAEAATSVAAIVYTLAAYLLDPDITPEERERVIKENPSHVLVAVLGFAGPNTSLSPERFVANLAGGNREALRWSGKQCREKATEVKAVHDEWAVVADCEPEQVSLVEDSAEEDPYW